MPRCVYAQHTLTQRQKTEVERIYESMDFTCGSDLFPADHEFYKTVYVKTKLDCNPITLAQRCLCPRSAITVLHLMRRETLNY